MAQRLGQFVIMFHVKLIEAELVVLGGFAMQKLCRQLFRTQNTN